MTSTWEQLREYVTSLGDNPYFGAGAGLFGIGALAALARRGAIIGNMLARRKLLISMEISNEDAYVVCPPFAGLKFFKAFSHSYFSSYEWVLRWINANVAHSSRHLSVRTEFAQSASGAVRTAFAFVPSPGEHYFWHGGRFVKVERTRESQMVRTQAGGTTGVPFETVTLTTLGECSVLCCNAAFAEELRGTDALV